MLIYKVRRKTDGLFSMGGYMPHFNKKGKSWKTQGHLNRHLSNLQLNCRSYDEYINNCEIVSYELVEIVQDDVIPLKEHLHGLLVEKEKGERDRQDRIDKYKKDQRRREFKLLSDEFGDE